MNIKKEQELKDAITNYVVSMTREQLEAYVAEDKTEFWFESGHINDELNPDAFIQDNPPLATVSEESQEALPPVRLDKQHRFQDWLDSVGYASQDERLEELYFEAGSEITSVRDALYTRYHMEKGYMDDDEFEKKAFDFYKELYPDHVIYPIQYLHNAELIKQAKIAQTLKFIGNGAIKLTPDQVTAPESPDQSEVWSYYLKLKPKKSYLTLLCQRL